MGDERAGRSVRRPPLEQRGVDVVSTRPVVMVTSLIHRDSRCSVAGCRAPRYWPHAHPGGPGAAHSSNVSGTPTASIDASAPRPAVMLYHFLDLVAPRCPARRRRQLLGGLAARSAGSTTTTATARTASRSARPPGRWVRAHDTTVSPGRTRPRARRPRTRWAGCRRAAPPARRRPVRQRVCRRSAKVPERTRPGPVDPMAEDPAAATQALAVAALPAEPAGPHARCRRPARGPWGDVRTAAPTSSTVRRPHVRAPVRGSTVAHPP